MAKVHPLSTANKNSLSASSSLSSSSSYNSDDNCDQSCRSSKRERFTVWMKSLVMQGNGCTVYDESGEIVYRVDNYDHKNSNEVFLMDLRGKVLFTIIRKSLWVLSNWEGYKSNGFVKSKDVKPLFQVKKNTIVGKDFSCKVSLKSNDDNNNSDLYRLEGSTGKSALRIIDSQGTLVAEAKRKMSSSGVILGDDVLTLVIEQSVDKALIMALVTVYGLMQRKL